LLEPGQIFAARYRVDRRIAEGGMGAIFEAEHTATERRVALKLLFPHIMSVASARKKFELEAKISARVNSPNIVEVLDAGFDEATKSPFLVMELLEGQTLAQHVRDRGPLSADQALPLLAQVAAGLDAAHGYREANGTHKPIVHRDLKPENLFIAREHGVQRVKILDFGIAKVLGETGNVSQEVRGTPLYMAFEQVTAGALSPQTDVWALGLIAYFMLTARHYWRSASEPSANVQSLFAEILSLPLEAASVRSRQQHVNVELPPAFDAWLLECIDRDPARRFASAGLAVDALAQAFGKNPRSRPRVDSKPVRSLGMAVTEAYHAPTPALPKALGTAASLPGITSERGPSRAPAPAAKPRTWRAAVAAGAVLLLGVTGWLVLGQREPGAAPHAAAPTVPTSEAVTARTPGVSVAPAAPGSRSPIVAPANDEPAREPSATAATDLTAPSAAAPSPPEVRLAPRDEPSSAAVSAPAGPLPAPAVAAAPTIAAAPARTAATASSPAPVPSSSVTPPAATPPAATPTGRTPRAAPDPPPAAPAAPTRAAAPIKKPPRGSEAYKMR
jgi:eukaryotic-like serine/threonine-protein kinase